MRHFEEDAKHADEERHGIELLDAQDAEPCRERYRQQQTGPGNVGRDEHRSALTAIDPDPRQETAEQEWRRTSGGKQSHLHRRSIQSKDRHQRQGQRRDLGTEQRRGLGGPQPSEVACRHNPPSGSVGIHPAALSDARCSMWPSSVSLLSTSKIHIDW